MNTPYLPVYILAAIAVTYALISALCLLHHKEGS